MNKTIAVPTSLIGAVKYFADPDVALAFMAAIRWPDGVACPYCDAKEPSFLKTRRIWSCRACRKQFSVKVGTIFEDSPLPLSKWLPALWMLTNCKNGISSYELHRGLGVTQKTAWFMLHRIRLAMQTPTYGKIGGEVEIDETFIGGRGRFMHPDKKKRVLKGRKGGTVGKTAVMGVLSRDARKGMSLIRAEVAPLPKIHREHAEYFAATHVEPGSIVYTDAHRSYIQFRDTYLHKVIDHAVAYAQGKVHTNGLENFWSLLKRAIRGTYVSVEPFHLFRYLDEQMYRFNNRKTRDAARFIDTVRGVVGKRVTYPELIGKHLEPATT